MRGAHSRVAQRYPKPTTLKTLKYGAVYTSAVPRRSRRPLRGRRQTLNTLNPTP